MGKEEEYKEIFLSESLDSLEELNKILTVLERNYQDKKAINSIFRIVHTIKGNSAGLGFDDIAKLAHTIEDLFGEIKSKRIPLDAALFGDIFKAIDTLSALVLSLNSGKIVRYHGIKTKIEVLIKRKLEELEQESALPSFTNDIENTTDNQLIAITPDFDNETEKQLELDDEDENESIAFSDLVQVPVKKLDALLNLVSELTIERDRLMAIKTTIRHNEFARLYRISSDLQYSIMDVRLVQVGFLFNKFHRVIRDTAIIENKLVDLFLEGSDTEIDRNVLQIISDSLIHIVRNAVSHGIENDSTRKKAGKPKNGKITMRAKSESDSVIIEIEDDGGGIDASIIRRKSIEKGIFTAEHAKLISDQDILNVIFEPGFSSVDKVTAVSGRGVGMDVVKKSVDAIGGSVNIQTVIGQGTLISLKLPSSMAVKGTLLFEVNKVEYAIPLIHTEGVISITKESIYFVNNHLVTSYQGANILVVSIDKIFNQQDTVEKDRAFIDKLTDSQKLSIIIVSCNGKQIGFIVDKLLQQKEIVEKPLKKPVDHIKFISGVTILGNGNVCLVIHVVNIFNHIFKNLLQQNLQFNSIVHSN